MKSNRSSARKRIKGKSNKVLLYLPRVTIPDVPQPAEAEMSPEPENALGRNEIPLRKQNPAAKHRRDAVRAPQESAAAAESHGVRPPEPSAAIRQTPAEPAAEARPKQSGEASATGKPDREPSAQSGRRAPKRPSAAKGTRASRTKGRKGNDMKMRRSTVIRPRGELLATVSNRKPDTEAGTSASISGTKGSKGGTNRSVWPDRLEQLIQQVQHKKVVLIPPTADWRDPVQHRAHHFAHAFARAGYLTFFMTPNERFDRYSEGFHQISSHLYITNVPMRTFRQLKKPILLFNHPTVVNGVMELNSPEVIYDFRDYPGEVRSGSNVDAYTEHAHHFLYSGASLVIASDDLLLGSARRQRPDTVYCPDGIDYSYFGSVIYRQGLVPEDISAIVFSRKPIIGYYGTFASWFDYELLQRVAEMRPEYQFLLIGPDIDGSLQASGLAKLANVAYLGAKPYEDVASYLPFIDVGVIPFMVNERTISAFPLKMYEYMAAGRPVVSTELPKCAQHPYVHTARNAKQFSVQLEEALRLSADSRFCFKLREYAKAQSWDARVTFVLDMLRRSDRLSLVR